MNNFFALLSVLLGLTVMGCALGSRATAPGPVAGADDAAAAGGPVPVVVELFTSEGCSSCPPADALLSRLEKTQPVPGAEVIALAQHVDYWNHLGWRDPFSAPEFSARQGGYARAFGKDGVYTPQMVVDGRSEFPGGNQGMAFDVIGKAARAPKAEVRVARAADQSGVPAGGIRLDVRVADLPELVGGDTAEVLLAITEGALSNQVSRGENSGRRLSHGGRVNPPARPGAYIRYRGRRARPDAE